MERGNQAGVEYFAPTICSELIMSVHVYLFMYFIKHKLMVYKMFLGLHRTELASVAYLTPLTMSEYVGESHHLFNI